MNRLFVHSTIFDRKWKQANLSDETLRQLQEHLVAHPDAGAVIRGTDGLRKIRWFTESRGKRGGIRVFYVDFPKYEMLFLLTLLMKNEREELTQEDYRSIDRLIAIIRQELEKKK